MDHDDSGYFSSYYRDKIINALDLDDNWTGTNVAVIFALERVIKEARIEGAKAIAEYVGVDVVADKAIEQYLTKLNTEQEVL